MRDPGNVLLVACYELGHQPLAVAWPAAVLERRGYHPALLDLSVAPFDPDQAARARVVAIAVPMHTALRIGLALLERLRDVNLGGHVCFYGLYAGLNAAYLLGRGADSVIAGEAEEPLAALIEALAAGADWRAVPGVGSAGRPAPAHLSRPSLPAPSRSALPPLERYVHLEHDGRQTPAGYVEASRGCLHLCRHCPIPPVYGGRFFAVPVEVCVADARQQIAAGARHITFGDPDFLNGPTHALRVARALHGEFPDVTFDFTAKIEHLLRHRALLPDLGALGGLFVVSAAESLSDTVLGHLDKGHKRADVLEALSAVRAAGMAFRPTWVAFTPWTTLEDYRELLDFIDAEDLVDHVDPVQYGLRLLVPPGSLLLDHAGMQPHLTGLVEAELSHRWRHPDPRMDQLCAEAGAAVASAAARKEDAAVTFERVRALADAAAGGGPVPASVRAGGAPRDRTRAPRLTEAWFC